MDLVQNSIHISDFIAKMGQSYGSNYTKDLDDVQLLFLLDDSDPGLPETVLLRGLNVPRCLDELPLGLLLVLRQLLLGQALKVQVPVQLGNLNNTNLNDDKN